MTSFSFMQALTNTPKTNLSDICDQGFGRSPVVFGNFRIPKRYLDKLVPLRQL
jgi:hypothetical protein